MNTVKVLGYAAIAAGGAGVESFVELWNAAGSGKAFKVTKIVMNNKDTVVKVKHHTAQQGSAGTIGVKGNKTLGGNAPVGALYAHGVSSVSGTQISQFTMAVDTDKTIDLKDDPIIVLPGKSLILENNTDDLAITYANIDWEEVDIEY